MAVYLCRWPSGEFSIVSARTKSEAIILLDEWGNAEQAKVSLMRDCMFDFRLDDDGEMELTDVGEAAQELIMRKCYPVLDAAFGDAEFNEKGGSTEKSRQKIREAVEKERSRLWENQPKPKAASTELGRKIQEQTGAASVLVDRIVRDTGRKILESDHGEDGEPNWKCALPAVCPDRPGS